MSAKIYTFLVVSFLFRGIFAAPFHFGVQEPVDPFVGRHGFLQNLHEALTRKVVEKNVEYSSITFLTGRGGIGKTETTRKYIEIYAHAFDNVIWIEAENELAVENSFRALAQSVFIADGNQVKIELESTDSQFESGNQSQKTNKDDNIPESKSQSQSKSQNKMTDETVQKIYKTLGRGNRRTLMIFDNVDKIPFKFFPSDLNENSNEPSNSELVPLSILFIRKNGQSSRGKRKQQMEVVKWLSLDSFTDHENINYIFHYPNMMFSMTSDDLPEVKVIENTRLLGQLFKQAVAFMSIHFKKHPEKGIEYYLNLLYKEVKNKDGAKKLLSLNPMSSTKLEPQSAALNPIFLTWRITRGKLSQGSLGNFTVLIMDSLPFFPPSKMSVPFLFSILSGGKEPFRDQQDFLIKSTINTLHRHAIVNIDQDRSDPKVDPKVDLDLDIVDGTLSMHRELQKAILKAFKEGEKSTTTTKFIEIVFWLVEKSQEFLDQIIEKNEDLSLNELYSLVALLDRLESTADGSVDKEVEIQTMRIIALTRFKVALRFQKLASFEGERNCRKLLNNSLNKLKQIEPESESESILKDSGFQKNMMKLVQRTFISKIGYDDEGDEITTTVNRALALKSLKLQEIVLDIATKVLGNEHPFRLACLNGKADAMWRIKSPPSFRKNALALYHQVYEAYKTLFGSKSQDAVLALSKLAEKYHNFGDLTKSHELYSQVVDLAKEVFGPTHPLTIATTHNFAANLGKMGKSDEALKISQALQEAQQAKSKVWKVADNVVFTEAQKAQFSLYNETRNVEKDMEMSNLHNLANNHVSLKQPLKAYKIWEGLFNEDLKRWGPDDLRTVNHESELARILFEIKDYAKAMKMQLHVLEIREKILGPHHSSTMDTKFDLANLYHEQRNYDKALDFYTIVYDFRNKTLGEENEYTLATLKKLADVHSNLNNEETAYQMKRQIYTIKKKLFGEGALETMNALSELATATDLMEENTQETTGKALKMYKKVYNVKKKLLGATHDETLAALFLLTNVQAHQGEHEKAIQQLEAAYEFLLKSPEHGPESILTGATLHAMSHVRQLQGKNGAALKLDLKALEIHRTSLGPEHANTIRILENIASTYYHRENYDEALKYYEEAHSTISKLYGPENPKTLEIYEYIGAISLKLKDYEKAWVIYNHILETRSNSFGEKHPKTLEALFNLAVFANDLGRNEEALEFLDEVVAGQTASLDLGPSHEVTLTTKEYLALTYTKMGNFKKALKTLQGVYEGRRANVGEDYRNTLGTLQNMAICNFNLDNVDKAVHLITQVYNTRVKKLGPEHPDTKKALKYKTSMESKLP